MKVQSPLSAPVFLPANKTNKAIGVALLYEVNSCCSEITCYKTRQNDDNSFKLTLTKASKVPSSMSLAAFLRPRENESIAPKNTKNEVIVDDLENI